MERVIDVIVSCSNRKKYPVPKGLALRQVVRTMTFLERVHHWLSNLRKVNASEHSSEELYAGDHWSIVRTIASQVSESPSSRARLDLFRRIWLGSLSSNSQTISSDVR